MGNNFDESKYNYIIDKLGINYIENRNLGDKGSLLSGGEKQKICFARFLYNLDDEKINIIDEPFTNLDAINKEKLTDIFYDMLFNKPCIIISHDLFLINRLCNIILFIDNLKAIIDTHENLIKNNSNYKFLYDKNINHNIR